MTSEDSQPSGVTIRAVLIGLVFVAGFGFLIPYLTDIKHGADLGLGPVNPASVLTLIVVLGPINGLLLLRWRRAGLTRKEILTIYAMVAATAAIAGVGYAVWVNIMVTASHYLATPENRWDVMIQPHIPVWLQLNDPMAIRWLWETIPENTPVPLAAWRQPLLAWGAVAFCIYVGSFSLMSLVRRDWIEAQRLVFPLAQIPLETVGHRGTPGTALLGSRVFWVGFAAAFLYGMIGLLSTYFPAVGVMCLVPVEVSLSFWLFNLVHFALMVGFTQLGLTGQGGARYGFDPYAFMDFQTAGALVGFGVFVLWQSRRAIIGAVKSWRDPAYLEADPLDLLQPRYALLGLVLSTAGLCLIANAAGAQSGRLLVLLFFFYMTALSLTRVIAAAGTNHVECGPQIRYLLDYGIGTAGARPGSFVLLNQMDAIFMTEFKVSFMHYAANDMKIFHSSRLRGTSVVIALALAVLVMLAVGSVSRVYTDYHRGVGTLSSWAADMVPRWEWGDMVEGLENPRGPNAIGIFAMVAGGVIVSALALLQTHVAWWRLSPVGFLFQPGTGLNRFIWANAIVGWLIVTLIFRLGGLRLYQRLRPAFFGLFLGGTTALLLSNAIRLLTQVPGQAG